MPSFDLGRFFRAPSAHDRLAAQGLRPDIVTAAAAMATGLRSDATVHTVQELIPDDERVIAMIDARLDKIGGVLVLTVARVLFAGHQYLGGPLLDVPLAGLTAAVDGPGRLTLTAPDRTAHVERALGTSADTFVAAVHREQREPSAPDRDPLVLLAELRALRDAGAVDDAEYQARKARLVDEL